MKNRWPTTKRMTALLLLTFGALFVAAQNSAVATNSPGPVALPPGARDVLNLSVAKVSEDTIVSFIENSAAGYALNASEIVYLRDQGVSDRVINTMLKHRVEVAEAKARLAARTQTNAPANGSDDRTQTTERDTRSARIMTAPEQYSTQPSSTVYVAPSSPPPVYYDWYDCYDYSPYYYPYYRGYYGYRYPAWSFSFGFGSGYRGGGYHHRGGSHGGSHGGGSHRGHR